jgi:hypothetical protein
MRCMAGFPKGEEGMPRSNDPLVIAAVSAVKESYVFRIGELPASIEGLGLAGFLSVDLLESGWAAPSTDFRLNCVGLAAADGEPSPSIDFLRCEAGAVASNDFLQQIP